MDVIDAGMVSPGAGHPNVSLVRVAGSAFSLVHQAGELATIAACAALSLLIFVTTTSATPNTMVSTAPIPMRRFGNGCRVTPGCGSR